ncbi:HAD-IC family P-type ATPase [Amnibacterium kyonggiense]|uniref:Cation-transporting ATPase E n=1 Tax=Amnibacterium kyonggiense TaxID=595671 RepID=A0A4R7FKI8_9MICO|nr:HAD-IC family P-type ATPase [Amnibacterium kyonggiense]TDS76866.1 cation-transporting ATPase E [Amnibacterium kyonggiense]
MPASAPGADGLTAAEVRDRVAAGLTNAAPRRASRTVVAILRTNLLTLFNAVVAAGFVLLLAIGAWRDALFGLSAVANAAIGIVQEVRAKRLLDRLAVVAAPRARVLRDGRAVDVEADDVVLDDLLVLRAGDGVVADAVVVTAEGLEVDESLLTGEAEPVEKAPGDRVPAGSSVTGGGALARVDRTFGATFAGGLTAAARRWRTTPSEVRTALGRVLRVLSFALLPLLVVVVDGQMRAHGGWAAAISSGAWRDAAVVAVGAGIAMVPLGLVLLANLALAAGAVRLAGRRVLLRDLACVEVLARVDVLCIDKTGTLTDGSIAFDAAHPVEGEPPPGWRAALGWFGADEAANRTARALRPAFPVGSGPAPTGSVPFSSQRRWSAVRLPGGGTWVLGAPSAVLPGGAVARRAAALARDGLRTVLLATTDAPLPSERGAAASPPPGLRPAVLLTFRETVRPEAAPMLAFFRRQGVRVLVLSGDDPGTAAAVAGRAGLEAGAPVDAGGLPEDDAALAALLDGHRVLGRVAPEDKRRIVRVLQAEGHVVAMTGDGLNDVLALKEADLGIAMSAAPPATKAVAGLVLLDDRFDRLPEVVGEGRRVLGNIERLTMLALAKTSWAVVLPLVFAVAAWPLPILPRQLSVLDGLTIGIPAFLLALRPNERRYRPGFLRRALRFAVPAGLVVVLALVSLQVLRVVDLLAAPDVSTASVLVLGLIGAWTLAVCSRPIDVPRALVVAAVLGLVPLLVVVEPVRAFLALEPGTPALLAVVLPVAGSGAVAIELVARWSCASAHEVVDAGVPGLPRRGRVRPLRRVGDGRREGR